MEYDLVISGGRIYHESKGGIVVSRDKEVCISNGVISKIHEKRPVANENCLQLDDSHAVIYAFHDSHCHGGGDLVAPAIGASDSQGIFVFDTDKLEHNILEVLRAHGREGTGRMHISAMAVPLQQLEALLRVSNDLIPERRWSRDAAEYCGVDLEGIYFAPDGKITLDGKNYRIENPNLGAQNTDYMVLPTVEHFSILEGTAKGCIRRVCVGMDVDGIINSKPASRLVEYLVKRKIVVGFGHTYARGILVKEAILEGGSYVWVHAGNGQRTLNARNGFTTMIESMGMLLDHAHKVGAKFYAEAIIDLKHLDPTFVLWLRSMFGHDIVMVTDNVGLTRTPSVSRFNVAGKWATLSEDGQAVVLEGTRDAFCGSNATMMRCFKNLLDILTQHDEDGKGAIPMFRGPGERFIPLSFDDAVKEATLAASLNPARLYSMDKETGSIAVGKRADLLIFRIMSEDPVDIKLEHIIRDGVCVS